MNAPAFTPGPWGIVIRKVGPDEIRSADESAELICEFPYGAGAGADIQDAANANLIVAAPELYAQLEWAVKLLGGLPGFAGTAQIESMRAALAKAVQS